jgi:hypothetical protein
MPIHRQKKCTTTNSTDSTPMQPTPPLPTQQEFHQHLRELARGAIRIVLEGMPYRILCNGAFQTSQEARPGLGLASPHRTSLHNNRYGVPGGIGCIAWIPN